MDQGLKASNLDAWPSWTPGLDCRSRKTRGKQRMDGPRKASNLGQFGSGCFDLDASASVILGEGKLRFLNQAGGGQQVGLVLCPGEKAKIHGCQLLVSGCHRILVFLVTVLVLWDDLHTTSQSTNSPWIIGGDFNSISSLDHHKGNSRPCLNSIQDFDHCIINSCLISPPFSGSPFTWFGVRSLGRLWRRLDRIFINTTYSNLFPDTSTEHLPKASSNPSNLMPQLNALAAPLLLEFVLK
ncbi:unnamed protein product [Cuscuta campestris]|uniref:Endonuclease/exonuclease/phosphatase domain-containing protein n=1 Tax=Cuscuta campestris TaxID=132261 RepID=A0A484KKV8_9ASTE|nr:unnamed protein product [Cuscuta campestris]